jgi:ribosomal protein S18 acetylase RimI-like enzyme
MEVVKYQEGYFEPLFLFWKRLAEKVPYFFSVSPEKWRECLLEDQLGKEKMFLFQEILIAIENGQIVGFSQFGQPAFAWDTNGQKYNSPQIGVLRHFYFDEGRSDAANLLYADSEIYLNQFLNQHAFYHIFGMSCNAHHGKLHQSLAHIDRFLCDRGYQAEHENVYYTLELNEGEPIPGQELQLVPAASLEPGIQEYEIFLLNHPIGTIQVRYLDRLTGGYTTDIAYLVWIEVTSTLRLQGRGTKSMQLLISYLRSQNYHYLHLDTAGTNQAAQRFYERLGFQNRGKTRSYLKTTKVQG